MTHTQLPNARISVPIAYLLHVNGAHTNRRDQNAYDPGMDPQRGLWKCAISTLVQRSSGDKLLGSDLYQEIRLKAKNSFRSIGEPSRDEFFTNCKALAKRYKIDTILKQIVNSYDKWFTYNNVAGKPSWLKRGEVAQTVTKSGRFYCAFGGTGKEYYQTLNSDS
ncbi:hypothetical protein TNCV_2680431 [Trichonephila clavipes]|uniref:Uncharacterized protein n=1 Tax=Trichonephila clavipes TaxID=2585209 RepID=A0A8X6VG97_TRICX|nr:hypothetical protein TNCV_2680431 [Trichonephila clavipes]